MTDTPASAALARRRDSAAATTDTIVSQIKRMQKEFQVAMPRGAEAEQLIRDAITAVRQTRHLDKCDSTSVLGALMTCAQLGLRVGVLGQAWVLPFWSTADKGYRAQLIIGYQGYSELAHRHNKVRSFMPRTVYANDDFDIDYGISGTLVHRPAKGPRGDAIGYHSIAKYENGGYDFLYMTREDVADHRDKFATTRTRDGVIFGPWKDHFDAMANKTTQRMLAKHIPKSPDLWVAQAVDGGMRINLYPDANPEEATMQPVIDADPIDVDPVDEQPREMTGNQLTAINTIATERLHMNREEKLAYISQIVGRDITTTKELTFAEAHKVIDTMTSFADSQDGPK